MKIVLIGPVYPYRGGIAQFTTLLSKHLQESHHEIKIISYKRQYPKWLYPGKSDLDPQKKSPPANAHFLLDGLNPLTWFKTYQFIAKYKPDLVLLQWWTTYWGPTNNVLTWLCNRNKIPIGYIIHNVYPHEASKFDIFLTKRTLKQGQYFITLSERERTKLSYIVPTHKISLSPLPVFDNHAPTLPYKDDARKQLKLPHDHFIALFFGIIRPYKGLDLLLQSIAELKRQNQKVHLVIAGEVWGKAQKYKALIAQLNITSHVTFHDQFIPDNLVPLFFSAADVFSAPYLSGSQSASLRTAISYGLPIVVSDAIYDEELFNQLENYPVFTFPAGDIYQLTQSIIKSMEAKRYTKPIDTLWKQMVETIEKCKQKI